MFEELIEQVREGFQLLSKDEELPRLMAKVIRNNYNALIAEGFTPDQAVRIVAAQGVGIKTNN